MVPKVKNSLSLLRMGVMDWQGTFSGAGRILYLNLGGSYTGVHRGNIKLPT